MRRRLDLAATLVSDPEVLFLDEPTTGLDPKARIDLWSVLDGLVDRGTTILLTTQYLEEAERLADDIVVVDHGQVIARGDAATLKRQVGGDSVQAVVRDPDRIQDAAHALQRVSGAEVVVDRANRSVTAGAEHAVETLADLALALRHHGIAVDDLSVRQPTLDEAFLTLTGQPPREMEEVQ